MWENYMIIELQDWDWKIFTKRRHIAIQLSSKLIGQMIEKPFNLLEMFYISSAQNYEWIPWQKLQWEAISIYAFKHLMTKNIAATYFTEKN